MIRMTAFELARSFFDLPDESNDIVGPVIHQLALIFRTHNEQHADPHIEHPEHLPIGYGPLSLQELKNRRYRPSGTWPVSS